MYHFQVAATRIFRVMIILRGIFVVICWLLLASVFVVPGLLADEEAVDIVSEGTRAIALEAAPPKYPKSMLTRRVEGWVQLNYVVNPDGTTGEIEVVDSSVDGVFDKASVEAVKKFRYKPAQWNGFPATDIVLGRRITFAIRANDGEVGKEFYARFSAAASAIKKNEFDRAGEFIKKLEDRDQWRLAEVCYLDLLKGDYWKQQGDRTQALKHYNRALVVARDYAKPEIYESLLRKSFALNAATGNLPAALDNYSSLIELLPNLPAEDPAHSLNAKIVAFVHGEMAYVTPGTISARCESCSGISSAWNRKLLRQRFMLEAIDGEISEVKILCGNAYVSFVFKEETAWDVRASWGECSLTVLGEDGATFRLVEI